MNLTASPDVLRFGRLLSWQRSEDGHATWYRGRRHEIVKRGRGYADALGGGCQPGWHLDEHPDAPAGTPQRGPGVGGRLDTARRMAEVWIVTDARDRQPAGDAPNLVTAMGGGGAVFTASGGRLLVAWPDHDTGAIRIREGSSADTELVGTITPRYTPSAGVTWHVTDRDSREWAAFDRWHDACRAIGDGQPR
jgi:hypothetical protein